MKYCNSKLTILAKSSYHEVYFRQYQHSFVKQRFDTLYVADRLHYEMHMYRLYTGEV